MTRDQSQDPLPMRNFRPRGPDRRASNRLSPPPYRTADGLVTVDRRSPVDRRACWIRDFILDDRNGDGE
jgi:hypothetical protein